MAQIAAAPYSAEMQQLLGAPMAAMLSRAAPDDVEAVLRLLRQAAGDSRLRGIGGLVASMLGRDFNGTHTQAIRSYLPLGLPLAGFDRTDGEQGQRQAELLRKFLGGGFDARLRAEVQSATALEVVWDAQGMLGFLRWLGVRTLESDLSIAAFSLAFVYLCICLNTRSLFLGTPPLIA